MRKPTKKDLKRWLGMYRQELREILIKRGPRVAVEYEYVQARISIIERNLKRMEGEE